MLIDSDTEIIDATFNETASQSQCYTKLHKDKKSKGDMYSSGDVAKILNVSRMTIDRWRNETLFGCPILPEDLIDHNGVRYYFRNRIDELAKVFRKDWRTAWANPNSKNNSTDVSSVQNVKEVVVIPTGQNLKKVSTSLPRNIEMEKNDLISLANEINSRPILTEYLQPTKRGFICIECGNGEGDDGTGAVIKDNKLKCGKCQHSFNNVDIIAHYLNLPTRGKDFVEVVKYGCQIFGLPFNEKTPAAVHHNQKISTADTSENKPFERLAEAQRNLEKFVESQGGKWRGLSIETLQRMNAGFLPDVYFPKAGKKLPAVVIPNDLGGVYFRSITGKFHKNNSPMATTTIFLPDTDNFDLVITEGQINAASIFQAVFLATGKLPDFGIIASGGTGAGLNTILPCLNQLKAQGKKFRAIIAYDYDSNNAGQIAAEKTLELILRAGYAVCKVYITETPDIDVNNVLNAPEGIFELADKVFSAVDNPIFQLPKNQTVITDSQYYFRNLFSAEIEENKKFANRKTGFSNIDNNQIFKAGLYVIGATPAAGKTTFCWQLLDQLAQNGELCIFCSYEMARLELYSKTVASELFKLDSNTTLTAADIQRGAKTSNLNSVINTLQNRAGVNVLQLSDETVDDLLEILAPICKQADKPPVVVIDYLQIIPSNERDTKHAIDDIVRKLKNFQRETNTTFIVVSSFNRTNYNLSVGFESFKESGNIEYSADVVWAMQLNITDSFKSGTDTSKIRKIVDFAKKHQPREIKLKCLKNRSGNNYDCFFKYFSAHDTFKPCKESDFILDFDFVESEIEKQKSTVDNDEAENEK